MSENRVLVGVPRETYPGETRVALVPTVLPALAKAGISVVVETGAGAAAGFPDDMYQEHGATIGSRADAFGAEIVVQIRTFGNNPEAGRPDLELMRSNQVIVGLADPLGCPEGIREVAQRGVSLFAMEVLPRISRAQSMDVLSSQATVAGYRAVLMAADLLPKVFPMMTTAAGTVPPVQVFVIGAGVAGLMAIATAKRLGAVVQGYDVRPAAQEDIESLGARAVVLPLETTDTEDTGGYAKELGQDFYKRQQEVMAQVVAGCDVVVTTALIPGRPAPVLVTEEAVRGMERGSVIVDCAAERGGNCAVTRADQEVITDNHVTVLGPTNLPADVPNVASQMYAKNMVAVLNHLVKEGTLNLDLEDEVTSGTLAAHAGQITQKRVLEALGEVEHVEQA